MARNYILIEHGSLTISGPPPYEIAFTAPFEDIPSLNITPIGTDSTNVNINIWIESISKTTAKFSLSGYDASYMLGAGFNWRAIHSKF